MTEKNDNIPYISKDGNIQGFSLYNFPDYVRLIILAKLPKHAEIVAAVFATQFTGLIIYVVLPDIETKHRYLYQFSGTENERKRVIESFKETFDRMFPQRR